MIASTPPQIKIRKRRPLPPGRKLILIVLMVSTICTAGAWFLQGCPNVASQLPDSELTNSAAGNNPECKTPVLPFKLQANLTDLSEQLKTICAQPKLHTGVFVVEPVSGRYLEIDARRPYSAASMIKLPVLVSMLQAMDAGVFKFDRQLTIRPDLIGGGSGWLQWRKPGSKLSLQETAEMMMIISDNTATNMIIDMLGGKAKCNADFHKWGLLNTGINEALPDLSGTNTTSPYDLALLLGKIDAGELLMPSSRTWLLNLLERNKIRSLLPQGLPPGSKISNKTGDIATLVGDAGIITAPGGNRYIAVVSVERPYNDRRANALIRQVSNVVYAGITGDDQGAKSAPCMMQSGSGAPGHRTRSQRHHHR